MRGVRAGAASISSCKCCEDPATLIVATQTEEYCPDFSMGYGRHDLIASLFFNAYLTSVIRLSLFKLFLFLGCRSVEVGE